MPKIILKAAFATAMAAKLAYASARVAFVAATTFGAYAAGRAISQVGVEPFLNNNLDMPGITLIGLGAVVVAPCVAGYYGMKGGLHISRKVDEAVNSALAAVIPAPKAP